jgi:hypothetical protein
MEAFLVGRCGKTQVQAARTSALEIQQLIAAKNREMQDRWELARWMRWHDVMYNPYVKQGHRPATPQAMMRFPWEAPEREITKEDCHVTPEEVAALTRIFEERDRRLAGKPS